MSTLTLRFSPFFFFSQDLCVDFLQLQWVPYFFVFFRVFVCLSILCSDYLKTLEVKERVSPKETLEQVVPPRESKEKRPLLYARESTCFGKRLRTYSVCNLLSHVSPNENFFIFKAVYIKNTVPYMQGIDTQQYNVTLRLWKLHKDLKQDKT